MSTSEEQFRHVMRLTEELVSGHDPGLVSDIFTPDAVFIEPPDHQLIVGHDQLRPYFLAVHPDQYLTFHQSFWDDENSRGACEYSYGVTGEPSAEHGMIIVEFSDGRIHRWWEYNIPGPADFAMFISTGDKVWSYDINDVRDDLARMGKRS
jgi:hypothetical protein